MIDKDIIIISKDKIIKLCEDYFHMGESGQLSYVDDEMINKSLTEILKWKIEKYDYIRNKVNEKYKEHRNKNRKVFK